MPKFQRYVSSELSHFVGRSLKGNPEAQYQLLLKILRDGALVPRELLPDPGTTVHVHHRLEIALEVPVSGNQKYLPSVICFCDIPIEDLPLHTRKYSEFGLSFSKEYLIAKGANPVFYVVRQSPTTAVTKQGLPMARAELFDESERGVRSLLDELGYGVPRMNEAARRELQQLFDVNTLSRMRTFCDFELFSFFKFFDRGLPDEDVENFYMEREWRIVGRVPFALADVERVFLPRAFAARFRTDLPAYTGQLSFSNLAGRVTPRNL